jgi:hypothetical protein
MAGLANICKQFGSIKIQGIEWVWDYVQNKPRKKSEMSKQEITASEKAKWSAIRPQIEE